MALEKEALTALVTASRIFINIFGAYLTFTTTTPSLPLPPYMLTSLQPPP